MTYHEHTSVLLKEAVDGLAIQENGFYIDGTFGRGGHSHAILQRLNAQGHLMAFDHDRTAIEFGEQRFKSESRIKLVHSSFSSLLTIAKAQNIVGQVDGILLDLGVSSPQ